MDVDDEANLKSRMLDSTMSTAAYDPSLPLPALCDIDDGNPEPLPEISDEGEIFSEDDNSNHSSRCDFYIESDADLLKLREAALESARARRAQSAAATASSTIPTVCVDKDLRQKRREKEEDDDMDIVDSPSTPMPDNDMDAALLMDVELLSANPALQKIVDEVEDGELQSASSNSGEQNVLNDDFSDELTRIADLAEWVVVDECEEVLDSIQEAVAEEEEEANADVNSQDADDEEELLALREILISNLRSRASAKFDVATIGSSLSVQESHHVGFDTPVSDNAEIDQATEEPPIAVAIGVAKSAVEETTHSQLAPMSDVNKQNQQQVSKQSIPISISESVISKPANNKTAKVQFASETKTAELDGVSLAVAEDLVELQPQVLSSVASAPNLTTIPSAFISQTQSKTSGQRRRVVGLSSSELQNRNKSVSQNSNNSTAGTTTSVSRRFVICIGDTSSESSSESSESESEAPPPPPPPSVVVVDDRARLQSLRHSVRAGASKLRAGLAADRQELQQRQAKLTEKLTELAEKRTAAVRLRQDTRRALELCAQLRKRSMAADAELRRLELIAAKEQRSLRARQTAFRARESRVLAALNESNLLRRVCPPTPSTMSGPLDPFIPLCPFGLHGSCRDPACEYQHLIDWRQPEHANRGRPNSVNSTSTLTGLLTTSATTTQAVSATIATTSTIHRRVAPNNNNSSSVSVKDFCDACEKYVTVSGAHLRDDPRCESCQSAIDSPEQAIAVLHHFLCRLRIRQSKSSDSRDCITAAEAFANRITGQYPNHVGLVLHSLELRRLAKRPVPVALLKTLLNRVPNCGIVRRAIRLQLDYTGQRQLLEFSFALPELLNSADTFDLLQLALSHCRLLYLAAPLHKNDNEVCLQQIWPTGPPSSMSKSHAAFLQLCRLYLILTGEPPELPTTSLISDTAILAELPIFFELKPTKLVTGLRQILVAAGVFQSVSSDTDEKCDDDSCEDRFKPEALTASICDWLIGPEPICPFRHCLLLLIARCLAYKYGANLNGLSAIYRLLAVRRAFLPALPDWLSTVDTGSTAGSLTQLLHGCGAASVSHWPDLAHSAVRWRLDNWLIDDSISDEIESLLSMAISACYPDRQKVKESKEYNDKCLLYYRHLLGLLNTDEALHCQLSTPVRSVSDMDPESQLTVAVNYVRLLEQRKLLDAPATLSLISLTSSLSHRASINLLTHLATILSDNSSATTIYALCRELKTLLRAPCPASLATAAARFVDAIDWKQLNTRIQNSDDQDDDSAPFSVQSELVAMANRIPYCLPLLQSVCNGLSACDSVQDACALCLDSARFHQPTNPKFWLDLALGLVQSVHPGAIRPQLDLLERGLQLIPLCRKLWLTAIQLAETSGLKRTADRLKTGMNSRLGCGSSFGAEMSTAGLMIAAESKTTSASTTTTTTKTSTAVV